MPLTPVVEQLRRSREAVLEQFEATENVLVKRYAPGKWTVREILCHLADVEAVHVWRITRAIAEPGSRVGGFDQDAWADALKYDERNLELARAMFAACRDQIMYYLAGVREEQLGQSVEHSERGTLRLDEIARFLVEHTQHHLDQIKLAREGAGRGA